ncbi:MAG TPA: farnesyl diphosphate synthase [Candidatus Binataceae bacterium]|jgi:geranylgeranyl diphosphate synthase type II|nr:farnesyl diphosphate synthase [Candidatus Binataceae bacterium]
MAEAKRDHPRALKSAVAAEINSQGALSDGRPRAGGGGAPLEIERYLRERAAIVERALADAVVESCAPGGRLFEAMRYSLLAGGKRLRPVLALAACEAVGGRLEDAMGFACAIEMIHTYSLIHDDLPCMDDDDLRRGRPTNHKIYGEAIATLAGDALLTDAFSILAKSGAASAGVPPAALLATLAELAEAAGSAGMVAGQAIDLIGEGRTMTIEELEYLHRRKTGALFIAAVRGGARLGGAAQSQLEALEAYAHALGLAFQVIDDILDVEASTEQMGKRTGKDIAHGKNTYPALIGLDKSWQLARDLERRAHHALDGFDHRAEPLRALASFAVERRL